MKPRVEVYPEKNYKGEAKFYTEGTHEIKESFTQNELVGRTFFIISSKLGSGGKKYAVDNGGCTGQKCYYHLYEWGKTNINQVFTMLSNGVIKSVGNGLVMDVQDGKFQNGQRVWNYPQNNTEAQLWEYDSNTKNLKLKGKNFVLSIDSNKMENRSKLWLWAPDGNIAQQWDIQLCDVKDNFMARERFALRFYDPVPSFNSINSGSKTEKFTNRFYDPVPFMNDNDPYKPKSLEDQHESFNTHQAILYQNLGSDGYKSETLSIGDYSNITKLKTIGDYSNITKLKTIGNGSVSSDVRTASINAGKQSVKSGKDRDAGCCAVYTDKIVNITVQYKIVNGRKEVLRSSVPDRTFWKAGSTTNMKCGKWAWCDKKFPSMKAVKTDVVDDYYLVDNYSKDNNPPSNVLNDDIDSIRLYPYTDVIIYQDYDFKGKVWRFHNGKSTEWLVNLTDIDFNDAMSSVKIRAGAIDDKQTKDNNDTSGNSVCNIRYKVHMAGSGWSGWVANGKEAGKIGNRMEAIMFEYSGPGQMYARAHVADKGWLPWVSSGEVCGTTGQSLRMEGLEFKIEGVKNVYFGLNVYVNGKGWMSQVGLNKLGGTTGQSRQMEAVKITVSLSEVKAVSNKGKTITLVEFPKNWVITDLSTGKFSNLVGKPFIIKSRKEPSFVIDTGGHQNGGGAIKIYKRQNNFHVNQTWTVDKEGRLISWQNRNSILYTPNTQNNTKPIIVGKSGNSNANLLLSKWRLNDKNQICSINQPNQVLDISGGKMVNDTPIMVYTRGQGNHQIWDIEELKEEKFDIGEFKKWVGKKFVIRNKHVQTQVWDKGCDKFWDCKSSCTWTLRPESYPNQIYTVDDNGHISIYNDSKNVYTALGGSNDSAIKMQTLNNSNINQRWKLDTSGRISCAQYPNMFVTVSDGGKSEAPSDGKPVILWSKDDKLTRQFWIIEEIDPDRKLANDIGKFKELVGKTIKISPKSCGNMVVDSRNVQKGKGGDAGGNKIGIWSIDNNAKANQEWQIDSNGHILLAADKSYCIYASNTKNSTPLTLVKIDTLNQFDLKQYWTYDGSSILNLGGTKRAMDMDSKTLCKNGGEIHIYDGDNRSNQQWTVADKSVITKNENISFKSLRINPLTNVVIYEEELDKEKPVKKIEFHNGYRLKMYEIPDFSTYGLSSVKKIEVSTAKEDNKQMNTTTVYEGFSVLHKDGKFNCNGIILFTILITICIFSFALYLYTSNCNKLFGEDKYRKIFDWEVMEGGNENYMENIDEIF